MSYSDIDLYSCLPNATLAEVASWFIQNDTQLSITIKMHGRNV